LKHATRNNFFVGIFVIILLAVVIYFFVVRNSKSEIGHLVVSSNDSISLAASKDSDGDGLKDWEELLWGTNASLADSDSDGTNDGDEVASRRDPATPGPNDLLSSTGSSELELQTPSEFEAGYDPRLGENLTDSVALNLTNSFLSAVVSDNANPETRDQIIDSLLTGSYQLVGPKQYKSSDLSTPAIISKDDRQAIEWVTGIYGVLIEAQSRSFGSEGVIINKIAQSQDLLASQVSDLEQSSEKYFDIARILLSMEVPANLSEIHLNFLNSANLLGYSLEAMSGSAGDPLAFISYVIMYQAGLDQFFESNTIFAEYVEGANLNFTTEDAAKKIGGHQANSFTYQPTHPPENC